MSSRIIFVNPPISGINYEWEQQLGSKLPAIGLCSLAAYTREKGFDTDLLDAYNLGLSTEDAVEKVLEFAPTHVGITAMTTNIGFAADFAKAMKKRAPGIVTIIGGAHVSAMPMETMEIYPEFDMAVLGEGEETVTEILELQEPLKGLEGIKGIVYRDVDGGLKRTERRPYIEDLDKLPYPAWDLLPDFPDLYRPSPTNYKQLPVASLVTSRGCPFKCTFCDRSVFGNKYRYFSAEYMIGMIKDLRDRYGIREICFYDDTFTANRDRLRKVCEYFIENDLNISWSCLGRVDLAEPGILALMKRAGCWMISYGIESAAQEILDIYLKKINLSQVEDAVRMTRKAGILTRGFFIIGGPKETDKTIGQMKDLIRRIPLDDIHLSFFTPIPGSELYATADKYGTFSKDWTAMDVYTLNFVPYDLTGDALVKYRSELYRDFYFRPSRLWRYFIAAMHPKRMREILGRSIIFLKLLSKKA